MRRVSKRFIFILSAVLFSCLPLFAGDTNKAPDPAANEPAKSAALPDAPAPQGQISKSGDDAGGDQKPAKGASLPQRFLNEVDPGYLRVGDKWDVTINKGEIVRPFTRIDKLHYAYEEQTSPFVLFEAAYSAGYEHLRDTDPHFGSDKAGFGERLGAAAFRQGTYRLFGDGIFPALFDEDPRFYRESEGSIWHRAKQSAVQVIVNHRDDGSRGIAYSTLLGEAVSNGLPLTFYPEKSVTVRAATTGYAISLVDDAAFKLLREFLPDVFEELKLIPKR